jgi:hypothetical protein
MGKYTSVLTILTPGASMKFIFIAIAMLSFNAFAATVDLQCVGASLSGSEGEQIMNQKISVPDEEVVWLLVEKNQMRVVTLEDLSAADAGKYLIMLGQNNESGANGTQMVVLQAKVDFNEEEGVSTQDVMLFGDINKVDFTVMHREGAYALQCRNVE